MKHAITFLFGFFFATACRTGPAVVPDPSRPPPLDGATCNDVCEHLEALSCPAAAPSPGGESCEFVCENVQDSGLIEWDLGCRAVAPTCDAVDRCEE